MAKKLSPIVLTDEETGKVYTLDFDRRSIAYAENHGFNINELSAKPMTMSPMLFFFSFRKNHPEVTREQADEILFDKLGGMSDEMMERLGQLYAAPFETLMGNSTKNSKMTVRM